MAWYGIVLIILAVLFVLTIGVYWFNLDNKLIFYVVRTILNKNYDRQKRDRKL